MRIVKRIMNAQVAVERHRVATAQTPWVDGTHAVTLTPIRTAS